jgi:MerR family copper efflux transcriptional regulator
MNIGQAATQSGLPVKTLRYYEEIGLVKPARTEGNDYRDYSVTDVEHLRFLQRARAVGFYLLYRYENRRCSQVKRLVLDKIEQVETQLQELHALKSILTDMAEGCAGDDSADCTIIEALAQPKPSFMPFMLVESSS